MAVIEEVTAAYHDKARTDQTFLDELDRFADPLRRPASPLYEASRLSAHVGGARIFLKREDLNHTGSHKINNVLGQALLARQMGKTGSSPRPAPGSTVGGHRHRLRSAGSGVRDLHGRRRHRTSGTQRRPDAVARCRGRGRAVRFQTLKDAINDAFRDWVTNADRTYYCFGTAAGPHPFPLMVRDFQRVVGLRLGRRSSPRPADCPMPSPPVWAVDRTRSASSMPSSTIRESA